MDYGRNDWLAQHTDDAIYHCQLMAEDRTMDNAADLLLAERTANGQLVALRLETKRGQVNLTAQQLDGLLRTIADVAPAMFANVAAEETGRLVDPDLCQVSGLSVDECEQDHGYRPPTWDQLLGPIEAGDLMRRNQ